MNMVSTCARFHVDIPSRYRLNFNPTSAIEFLETANFVNNFVQKTNASAQLWWQI